MPLFKVEYIEKTGEQKENFFLFQDQGEALAFLDKRQAVFIQCLAVPESKLGLSLEHSIEFTRKLHALLRAEIPLFESLEIAVEQSEPPLSPLFFLLKTELARGTPLYETLEKLRWPLIFCTTLKVGEESGEPAKAFERLHYYLKRESHLWENTFNALIYPGILFLVASATIMYLTGWVVPVFAEVLSGLGGKMPTLTRVVMEISRIFKETFWLWPMVLILVAIGLKTFWKSLIYPLVREILAWLPLVGPIIRAYYLARFSEAMATLMSRGVPLPSALDLAVPLVEVKKLRASLSGLSPLLKSGLSFLTIFKQNPEAVDRMMKSYTLIGEETNSLPRMYEELSLYYNEELEVAQKRFLTLLEPMLMIVMGTLMAILLLSMFFPILELSTLGGR